MTIITLCGQKGGTGKTTTAAALGAGMRRAGVRVLYVDLDAQGSLSYILEADHAGLSGMSSLEVLEGTITAEAAIQHTASGDVIAASPALSGADSILTATGREYRLREALEPLRSVYDVAIIDAPPNLGICTINALTAADGCIVPAQADVLSLQGVTQLHRTIESVKRYCNHSLRIYGLLLTRYNGRTNISRDAADMLSDLADQMHTRLYSARIRECTAVKEAQAMRTDIYSYAPRSNAAADYESLTRDLMEELHLSEAQHPEETGSAKA